MVSIQKDVLEELQYLDEVDLLVLLSIGKKPATSTRIQRIAFLLSELLKIKLDVEPYSNGVFSETIFEKIHEERLGMFIRRKKGKIELTEEGLQAYQYFLEELRKKRSEIVEFLKTLHNLSDDDLLALIYHLYPEIGKSIKVKEKVLRRLEKLKSGVKVYKDTDKIVIDVEL